MLIAVEGIDGSGKATQVQKLVARLTDEVYEEDGPDEKRVHRNVFLHSFPAYDDTTFGPHIKKYLRGGFGPLDANDPFLVSLLYALDRFERRDYLMHHLGSCQGIVVCDRYVASNLAHQGSKLAKLAPDNWKPLARDIEIVEYEVLGLPKPDLVIYLDLTAEQSYKRTHARDDSADIHQDNIDYLYWVREVYLDYASTYKSWHPVKGFDGDRERTVDEIHEEIWEIVTQARAQFEEEILAARGAVQ